MRRVLQLAKGMAKRGMERDRYSERYVEAVSRFLWPWRDSGLLYLVVLLAMLDYISTYVVLELNGSMDIYEGGALASWALRMGGFGGLFLVELAAVSALLLAAVTMRSLCSRLGFKGYGRTSFVVLLVPYAVVALAAVVNNLLLTYLYSS